MHISTSVWGTQHPNTDQNLQQMQTPMPHPLDCLVIIEWPRMQSIVTKIYIETSSQNYVDPQALVGEQ